MEERDRPVVHVEIELEARAEQDVARVPVVGDAGVAQGADEHGVEPAQEIVSVRGNRDAGREVVVGPPREVREIERTAGRGGNGIQHLHRFGRDLLAYPVTGDYGNAHGSPAGKGRSIRQHLTVGGV